MWLAFAANAAPWPPSGAQGAAPSAPCATDPRPSSIPATISTRPITRASTRLRPEGSGNSCLRADMSGDSRAVATLIDTPTTAGRSRILGLDEERAFRLAESGDAQALAALVERFMPLARSVASRYARSGEPLDDLVQVASVGLIKAIKRFDPDRGLAFSSYAVPTMTGELRRHFRDRSWAVRPPRGLQEAALQVSRTTDELSRRLGHPPTIRQIGQALEMTDEQVLEARTALNG